MIMGHLRHLRHADLVLLLFFLGAVCQFVEGGEWGLLVVIVEDMVDGGHHAIKWSLVDMMGS